VIAIWATVTGAFAAVWLAARMFETAKRLM
jgi:hypothetical protein